MKKPWKVEMDADFEFDGVHDFASPRDAIAFLREKFPAAHLRLEANSKEKGGMISAFYGATIYTGGGSDYGWMDVGDLFHAELHGTKD